MLVRNASPRGPMWFRCLLISLSEPCELLFCLCFGEYDVVSLYDIYKFHSGIRKLKTQNPRVFWNVIKTETNTKQSQFNATIFVVRFCELNSDPLFLVLSL